MQPTGSNIVKQKDNKWEIEDRGEIPYDMLRNKQKIKNVMKEELWLDLYYLLIN